MVGKKRLRGRKKPVFGSKKNGFEFAKSRFWGQEKPCLGSEKTAFRVRKNGFEFVGFGVGKTGFEFAKNRFGVQKNKFASSWDSVCLGVKTCSKDGDDDDEHSTLNIPFTVSLKRQL